MKKFIKICIITGCICLVSGLITLAVGFNVTANTNMTGISIHGMPFHGVKSIIRDLGIFDRFDFDFDVYDDKDDFIHGSDFKDEDDFIDEEEYFNYIEGHKHHNKHHGRLDFDLEGYKTIGTDKISLKGIKEIEVVAECGGRVCVEGQVDQKELLADSSCSECIQYKVDEDELKIYIEGCNGMDKYILYVPEDMKDVEIEFELYGCEGFVNNVDFEEIKCEVGNVRNVKGADLL